MNFSFYLDLYSTKEYFKSRASHLIKIDFVFIYSSEEKKNIPRK
jgi:hypothetical protein